MSHRLQTERKGWTTNFSSLKRRQFPCFHSRPQVGIVYLQLLCPVPVQIVTYSSLCQHTHSNKTVRQNRAVFQIRKYIVVQQDLNWGSEVFLVWLNRVIFSVDWSLQGQLRLRWPLSQSSPEAHTIRANQERLWLLSLFVHFAGPNSGAITHCPPTLFTNVATQQHKVREEEWKAARIQFVFFFIFLLIWSFSLLG